MGAVDCVLTFEELYALFESRGLDVAQLEDTELDQASGYGRTFARSGGVAAAVAVADGSTAHGVDIRKVQDILVDQDVPLPRNAKFEAKDPSYRECVQAHQYGLYLSLIHI